MDACSELFQQNITALKTMTEFYVPNFFESESQRKSKINQAMGGGWRSAALQREGTGRSPVARGSLTLKEMKGLWITEKKRGKDHQT